MNRTALNRSSGVAVLRRSHHFQAVVCSFLLCSLCPPLPTQANPHGGVVVHGDVQIGAGAGGNLQILQGSQNAIIDWQGFSISAGELTQFLQPGSSSAVLNRVTGGDPSAIHGALRANGNVFLINPSGILVGPSGSIDVHGLVLSTLDVDNGEFLARGDMVFKGGSDKGVTNLGRISAIGGDVFLIGRTITNSGTVKASQGRVGLAAGEEVLLKADTGLEGERIFVRATGSGASGTGILNDGTIEGAAVELKAHGNLYALAINNKGSVRATGAENTGGRVFLRGAGGGIANSGSIEASTSVGSGGRVLIEAAYAKVDGQIKAEGGHVRIAATEKADLGGSIDVSDPSALSDSSDLSVIVESREISVGSTAAIDASGATGGGSIQIGGGFQGRDASIANAESLVIDDGATLRADALVSGNGGQVILWSDATTTFRGDISAQALGNTGDGGFVEVSGKQTLLYDGTVSTFAANGQSGTLLLDPTNFTITASGDPPSSNSIGNTTLAVMLAGGNVVITTASAGADAGDITVNAGANVNWNSANSLSLLAHRHIVVGANIQNQGTGGVHLIAGWNGTGLSSAPGDSGVTPSTFNLSHFQSTPAAYGNNGGIVHIGGGTQAAGVAVGSRDGLTYAAGHGIELRGGNGTGNRYAHLGHHATADGDSAHGHILVEAKEGGVLLQGGSGSVSFAQIGHGGLVRQKDYVANVTVRADRGALDGDVRVLAGTAGSFAHIGHGNRDINPDPSGPGNLVVDGNYTGDITVIGRDIQVLANGGHAQIGHGGFYARGDFRGNIFINYDPLANGGLGAVAGGSGALSIRAQGGGDHYAQVGHGGVVSVGNIRDGNIKVGDAASITLQAGWLRSATAQLGHGGVYSGTSTITGYIDITTQGNVSVLGGSGTASNGLAYSQIGHGGTSSGGSRTGDITIHSVSGTQFEVKGGTNTVAGTQGSYAQIGHGGDMYSGSAEGAITITASQASMELSGGRELRNYAQIGHGGYRTVVGNGTLTGAIDLSFGGDVAVSGGLGAYAYAQIGHGGVSNGNTMSGHVRVIANGGNLTLQGNGNTNTYAMIGHGSDMTSTGNRQGGMHLFASGTLSAVDGTGTDSRAHVAHQSGDGLAAINYTGGNGYQLRGSSAVSVAGASLAGVETMINGNLATGPVQVAVDKVIDFAITGTAATRNAADLMYILTGGAISFQRSYQNTGTGGVALVAGWNGTTGLPGNVAFAPFGTIDTSAISTAGVYGNGSKAITIGSTGQTDSVAVGSRQGLNLFAGYSMSVLGSDSTANAYSRIGFRGDGSSTTTGGIEVKLSGGNLTLQSGSSGGTYAQIGHGGVSGGSINAGIAITMTGGNVTLDSRSSGYTQIGHGGTSTTQSRAGSISVTGFGNLTMGGAGSGHTQIGHGGNSGHGTALNSSITVTGSGNFNLGGGGGYAMVGHGGLNANAASYAKSGLIELRTSGGAITIKGGTGASSPFALVGHGGTTAPGNTGTANDEILVRASGSVTLQAGNVDNSYAQIGNGGLNSSGTHQAKSITVISDTGNISLLGGTTSAAGADDAYVQIGHGTTQTSSTSSGEIRVEARQGKLLLDAGSMISAPDTTLNPGFALVGHGGHRNSGDQSGRIVVLAGAIELEGGESAEAFAQIGHGGAFGSATVSGALSGDIFINFDPVANAVSGGTGAISLKGGTAARAYAQIGHGGSYRSSTLGDNVRIGAASALSLNGGGATGAYAQIGHGGMGANGTASGNVTVMVRNGVTYGNVSLKGGGTDAYAQIGHGGSLNLSSHGAAGNAINVDGASVTVEGGSGTRAYAQIGMGGATSVAGTEGTLIGDVNINQNGGGSGAVEVKGGTGTEAYAQIGIGGTAWDGAKTGSTRVTGTAVNLIAGGAGSYAQIGAGGGILTNTQDFGSGTITGLTWVTATSGNVSLNALNGGAQAYVQIGAGGLLHDSTINGTAPISTTVSAVNGAVTLQGGGQSNTYAQIGVGGGGSGLATDLGHHNNAGVSVTARSVSLTAGGGLSAYTQIGSGGGRTGAGTNLHDGDVEGEVIVSATAGDVTLLGGTNNWSYAQIGHGGSLSRGALSGDVRVWASGSVSLTGRTGAQGYAQIGHGGDASSGAMSGDVRVAAQSGNLTLTGGSGAQAYAMTGHGSRSDSAGTRQGGIHLFANGTLSAGAGTRLFHQSGAGLSAANYLTDNDGVQLIGNANLAFSDEALTGVETMVNGNLGKGPVQVAFSNNINLTLTGADVALNNAEHFYLLTGGSITMLRSYQNAGTGGVWLGAGWIGDMDVLGNGTVDVASAGAPFMAGAAPDFARCSFGANGGALTFGATTQTTAVRVGSRQGTTAVAGHAVTLTASNATSSAATHLGFFGNGSGDMTGAILARIGAGGLLLQSGSGAGAYTQIGHGGQLSVSGNTTASATISVFFCTPGAVSVLGGSGTGSYAHIGHGGMEVSGGNAQRHGDISVTGFNSLTLKSGGSGAYTQIGHGGLLTDGDMNNANRSNIVVTGSGALVLESGGAQAYAQIGMGGVGSDMQKVGTVEVVAGSIKLDSKASGNAYTQIGHGGGISAASDFANGYLEGVVTVEATGMGADGSIRMVGGTGGQSYTQIGNGGLVANHTTLSGGTVVTAAGLLSLTGGTGGGTGNTYAQIGTGGGGFDGDIVNGYVTVTAGSVEMSSREGPGAYVQIGSGGGATSSGSNTRTGAVQGDVSVTTTGGGIEMKASQSATLGNFVQIGAGGGGYFGGGANTGTKIDSSTFVTTVGGGLTLDATNASYVQIGAGGANVDAEIAGRTVVNVGGALLVKGGAGENRYALVGSGGSEVDGKVWSGNADASVTVVSVVASGNIEVTGGTAANAFAQIGLGGRSATGERTGAILVESSGGSISLSGDLGTGSAGTGAYAQIGHGGREGLGKIDGNIKVSAKGGGLSLVGAVNSDHAYAQIGHGGERVAGAVREISGTICVDASGAILLDAARSAAGSGSHAKIGHGGRYINGASKMEGDITVVSLSGGIQLKGGAGMTSRFAQIGHGGVRADGTMGGHISVVAKDGGSGNAGDGSIVLTGGADYAFSYAMVGHGENGSLGETGNRSGGIHLFAENQIQTIGVNTSVTHISDGQLVAGRFGGGNGFQLIANGGTSFDNDSALRGVPTMANGSFGTGPVNFAFSNAIDIVISAGKNRSVDTSDGFHMLTGGSITMLSGYQNAGSGSVTLVAGWNGVGSAGGSVTFNGTGYCDPVISAGAVAVDFTNCAVTGNNSKTVTLGAANQTGAVRVGSRQGVTSVAGHGLTLYGSTTTASTGTQLGFYGNGSDASGAIDVRLKSGGLTLNSGSQTGSYTQIGHGGLGSMAGNTTSAATITISFCEPGDVVLNGSTGTSAYAQIGHGGRSTSGTRNGAISITGFRDMDLNGGSNANYGYAQIGHGGANSTFGTTVTGATITLSGSGNATIDGGGQNTHAMIGHGGNTASGVVTNSGIYLDMVGGIALTGGNTQESAAQIGHGGHNTLNLRSVNSVIYINHAAGTGTGDIVLQGGATNTHAMIGHGGSRTDGNQGSGDNSASGDIEILYAANVRVLGGNNTDGVAQIGHGGERSTGAHSGNIVVTTVGEIEVRGGTGGNYALGKIGHGGVAGRGTGATDPGGLKSGNITLTAGGKVTMAAGSGAYAAAQVGHGGQLSRGDLTGSITVTAGGNVELTPGSSTDAVAQIGHGGVSVIGAITNAAVTVTSSAEVKVSGGTGGSARYSQIGHGGRAANASVSNSAISVSGAAGVSLAGGSAENTLAQIGHGGVAFNGAISSSSVTVVSSDGSVSLQGSTGTSSSAHIGHGGRDAAGSVTGSQVTVNAANSLALQAGADNAFAQIGHGGFNTLSFTVASSNILVNSLAGTGTGDVTVRGGATNSYAMIGHGGTRTDTNAGMGDNSASGDVEIFRAANVRVVGGSNTDGIAQIGHGGERAPGAQSGAITVTTAGEIEVRGGTAGNFAIGKIGHGGVMHRGALATDPSGTKSGSITLNAGGNVEVVSGTGTDAYAQVGHGGISSIGDIANAAVTVNSGGSVSVTGLGTAGRSAQIGHGGTGASGQVTASTVTVNAVGALTVQAGSADNAFAQIGHGGFNALSFTVASSNIFLNSRVGDGTGDVAVRGGGTNSYAMIGHGGTRSDVNEGLGNNSASGSIEIFRAANVRVLGGSNTDGIAQIGHGGERAPGAQSGAITVTTAGEIEVRGGTGGNYAIGKIGHGGALHRGAAATDPSGAKGGDIALNAGGKVTVAAGSAAYASAQVGHGGTLSRGDFSGTIAVNAADEVKVSGGGSEAFAQIGHVGNAGTARDNVTVTTTGGAVTLTGGASTGAHAQIGHGGLAGLDLFGETSVTGTSVGLKVGGGANAYARIGHGGGVNQAFASTTSTLVNATAGGVTLDATGGGGNAYVQIGAGGLGGGGAITGTRAISTQVTATGAIRLMGGTAGNASAMIGNGGGGRDSAQTSSGTGVVGSSVSLEAASGGSGFVQIGAGGGYTTSGNEVTANIEGDVSVEATSGSIALLGGGSRAYAQIGNGGLHHIGNAKGSLQIVSAGDLLVEGGSVLGAYALVGHGGYLENGNLTTGTREGDVLVDVKGAVRLRDNGSSSFLTHRGAGGVVGTSRLALVADQLDLTGSTANVGTWIGSMANTGSVEIGITGGDLRVEGPAALFSSGYEVDLVASGNVDVLTTIRNAGTGAVNVAAGWDGTTGLVEDLRIREFPPLHALSISFADILADDASWGNGGGKVSVGNGAQTTGAAVGSAGGATTVLGHAVDVRGSSSGYALIGALPASNVSPTGDITVKAKEGGIAVEAGNGTSAYAQIGHRAQGSLVSALSGRILVDSGAGLALKGGAGLLSYAQIGHGGNSGDVGSIGGAVTVNVADDIDVIGGSGSGAYSQIGHGGLFTKGSMADDIEVNAGRDIHLSAPNLAGLAYAKIGHGDDVRGGGGGTGDRDGDIVLTAGGDIELESALVGHVNGSGSATAAGGKTWIGAARSAPGDSAAGKLVADAASEFSGFEEVRFYLPRRANNGVAAGAKINGEIYDGGVADPQLGLRPDEYTNYTLYEDGTLDNSLSHHDNTLGSGPAPMVSGLYAFYYDQTEIGTPPVVVVPGGPGTGGNDGGGSVGGGVKVPSALDYRRLLPDDRTRDKWLRDQEREYSRWGGYGVYYEGYPQYGPHGESVYRYKGQGGGELNGGKRRRGVPEVRNSPWIRPKSIPGDNKGT